MGVVHTLAEADARRDAAPADVIVMKFGSSVLAVPADAPKVASDIYAEVRRGKRVIAVVSAFAGETDRLISEVRELGLPHDNLALPAYVVQGEERSAALVAVACDRIGLDATTLTVRQLGIRATGPIEHARPVALNRDPLDAALAGNDVVVVPGFGAVSETNKIVLMGRGGSDLTALFLAATYGLDSVQLVKDVDGLYDRDPNADPNARRYDFASWMEATALGGGLVQPEALALAEQNGIRVEVRNYLDGHRTVIGSRREPPSVPIPLRKLRVALAGCGVVGGGALSRLLADPRLEVVGVLVRDVDKPRDVPGATPEQLAALMVSNPEALFAANPDILVEAVSDADVGLAIIEAALSQGVDVAAASKQAVSRDPRRLQDLAARNGARIAWSAAVGGGTPMIEALRAAGQRGDIQDFEAVLNGTVNFMLDRLDHGATFDAALAEARAAGFAEEDPSADLEGLDAVAKVRLLAYEAFGVMPDESDVGRDRLSPDTLPASGARQVARCRFEDGVIKADVRLSTGPLAPAFATLTGERNALRVRLADGATLTRRGRGAGRWATAESLLADVSDLSATRRLD